MINIPVRVFVHCSATPDAKPGDKNFDRFGAAEITQWHIERGFNTIGYHTVIRQTGLIEVGRPTNVVGAHVEGHNTGSIGVCYIGTKRPRKVQLTALLNLYAKYFAAYKIDYTNWYGHHEVNPGKECPGFSMDLFRLMLELFHKGLKNG